MGKIDLIGHWMEVLENSTAAVYKNENRIGTAWLCSNQYLLTAGHLFSDNDNYFITFVEEFKSGQLPKKHKVNVVFSRSDQECGVDFAILKLEYTTNRMPLPIELKNIKNYTGQIVSYGYGVDCHGAAKGEIIGPHKCYQNRNWGLLKIQSDQLTSPGYSGAAIFDISTEKVIGIQIESLNSNEKTILAFPIYRIFQELSNVGNFFLSFNSSSTCLMDKTDNLNNSLENKTSFHWSKEFIECHFLPLLAISILNLHNQDNLDAYVRCIVVKYKRKNRYTVYEAKRNDKVLKDLTSNVRKNHTKSKARPKDYGVVGIMNRQNVTVLCDFKNKRCYKISLSGQAQLVELGNFEKEAGDQEERIALLVSPIRDVKNNIVGVLSFDFFKQNDKKKDIIEIIEKDPTELDRLIFHAQYYAEVISKALIDELFEL